MKKKQKLVLRQITTPEKTCQQQQSLTTFAESLNDLRSEGDIRKDRARSAPLKMLPMV